MNIPNIYELVIWLIELNGRSFQGKTNVHKNIYLLQRMMSNVEFPLKFKPYFYGPYSQDVSEALDLLENGGLLRVKQVDFGVRDSFEVRKYVYELTRSGQNAARNARSNFSDFSGLFEGHFKTLKSTGYNENTKVLSTAAKVKHILSTERRSLNSNSIQAKAKELGWEINSRDLSASVKVLVDIGLARTSSK
jgi:uncharacterized protein YwgA